MPREHEGSYTRACQAVAAGGMLWVPRDRAARGISGIGTGGRSGGQTDEKNETEFSL